ncbi:MAG: C25 family cysteine peptidase [Bacteroidales bacterium]|jgi:hypothetical protein|nr:C25 family cysteine peptidase [Bacteroidales bacterium]
MKTNPFLSVFLFVLWFTYLAPTVVYGQYGEGKKEKMIIVSYVSFIPQLSQYIEAKANDNIDCRIISVDSLEDFNRVKAKIDGLYTDFTADFLLLVGDFQHIPAFIVEEGLSDIYYTFENENSFVPRMTVGRFSVETAQDLQTMIDRTLTRKPASGHVIGIASEAKSELTQKRDYEQVRQMGHILAGKGFSYISELFNGSQSEFDKAGNPLPSDVIAALQTNATWLNYAGYGSYEGWTTSGFESRHIDSLADNVELPIVVSASCLGGHFAYRDCFAEKWLRTTRNGNPVGATAVLISSSLADWDATLSAMFIMTKCMPSLDDNCRLGHLYLQGYNHIIDSMQRPKEACCWILFGDPSMWIYPIANNTTRQNTPMTSLPAAYPNPANTLLHIKHSGLVRLYDIQGKLILETLSPNNNTILDVSQLVPGIYFLSIQSPHKVITQKIIIGK